ncbi:hypothetical protein CC78DRAFT_457444, partial [Lojkania enalia]
GCRAPGPWTGVNSHGAPFPIFYTVRDCSDGVIRVGYSIYFAHDVSYKNGWENVIVS